jgi:Holliday junction DNA helicase RuvA
MISLLRGNIAYTDSTFLIIDVNGVGYKVYMAQRALGSMGLKNTPVQIFTYTHVREDMLELYGFLEYADLRLFEFLLGVSGIGPRTALGVFNNGTREEIIKAILRADTSFFAGVPRLGTKNAQKIIIELKGKLGSQGDIDLAGEMPQDNDALEALVNIGYSRQEARKALREIGKEIETTEEKIKMALRYLGKQ